MTEQPLALSTNPTGLAAEADYDADRAEVNAIKPGAGRDGKAAAPKSESRSDPAQDIFAAAERIQDHTWTMRERGFDGLICAQIEELAALILSASALRNPADRRAQKLGMVLRYLEHRIEAMLAGGGANAAEAPPPANAVPAPDPVPAHEAARDITAEIESELFASVPAPPAPASAIEPPAPAAARPTPQPLPGDPFAALRAMSDEERIALFT
jgi:hypothetical protein